MFLHHLANRLIVFDEDKVTVFEGSYQDFLDRVGWEDERVKQKKKKVKNTEGKADFNAEKYKKRLAAKTAKVEKMVNKEEKLLEEAHHELAQAYGKLKPDEIAALQTKVKKHQENIDKGYKDLERLIKEQDELNTG